MRYVGSFSWPEITCSGVRPDLLARARLGQDNLTTVIGLPDGIHDILVEDWTFRWKGKKFIVPKGFVTDYASIPRLFSRILPQRGPYNRAALAHDWLYWSGILTKSEADHVLYDLADRFGVGFLDRQLLLRGVQLGGWVAWRMYRRMEK